MVSRERVIIMRRVVLIHRRRCSQVIYDPYPYPISLSREESSQCLKTFPSSLNLPVKGALPLLMILLSSCQVMWEHTNEPFNVSHPLGSRRPDPRGGLSLSHTHPGGTFECLVLFKAGGKVRQMG